MEKIAKIIIPKSYLINFPINDLAKGDENKEIIYLDEKGREEKL